MTERPIIMSGPMVRAILEGRKTQTRRPIKTQLPINCRVIGPDPWDIFDQASSEYYGEEVSRGEILCPFGVPGDRLWVREAFIARTGEEVIYRADAMCGGRGTEWRSSTQMPRWASRITLEVVEVRAERVQEITEADCLAEGLLPMAGDGGGPGPGFKWAGVGYSANGHSYHVPGSGGRCRCMVKGKTAVECAFRELWNSIHGAGAFERNDYAWVVTFRPLAPPVAAGAEVQP